MRKHKKKLLFIVALFSLVVALPYLIDLTFVGTYIEKTIKNEYNLDASIEKTHWYWFPKPGFFLQNTTITDETFQSNIKLIAVYPKLSSLLSGTIAIKEVELITPEINVKSLNKLSEILTADTEKGGTFPEITFSLSNGILSLPFENQLAVLKNQIKPLNISIRDLEVTSESNTIQLTSSFETPFASKISSRTRISRNNPDEPLNNYQWSTHNTAINIDFIQVKKALLLLFDDSEDIHEVFDYIIQCDLKKADFTFQGTADEFINMDNIVATAEVENTEYHIQGTKIFLTDAKGDLRVENAVLHGSGLSATLKNSFGTNGTFSMGLAEDDFSFKLNFDIDADLSQLQETIDEFIDPSELKQQFGKINNLTGRTPVNLKLSDNLNDLKAYLFLPALSGIFHYDLLQRDIVVTDGVLDISPESITWSNLTFDVGVNKYSGISGSVNIQKELLLNITGEKVELDSADVYNIVTIWPTVEKTLKETLTDINGKIILSDIKLSGSAKNWEEMNYDFIFGSDNLTLSSPELPAPVSLSFSSATLSDNKIKTGQVKANYKDSALSAAINLNHTSFDKLKGSVIINGTAGKKISPWLKKKGWFHQDLFPQLPCSLSPLSVLLSEDALSITGNIIHGQKVNTLVDIKVDDVKGVNGSVEVISGDENAVIRIQSPDSTTMGKRKISFAGNISKKTVTSVINTDRLPGSNLKGQFDLLLPVKENSAIRMTGTVNIKDLKIPLEQNGALLLDNLKITAKNDYADLSNGNLTIICPDNLKGVLKKKFILSDLSSRLYFQYNEAALLRISSGRTCNIKIKGDLSLPSKKIDFKLSLGKKKQVTFDELFACIGVKDNNISGDVSIGAEIRGTTDDMSGSRFQLRAADGIVKQTTLLAKIVNLLDLTELFTKNPIKILKETGYYYKDIEIDAVMIGKKLHITRSKAYISGLTLFGTGKVDLETMEIDMVVLASPFKLINKIINSIPIIGEKMAGGDKSILSVPIKIEGKVNDPVIRILPKTVSNVPYDILNTFIKTFKLPFKFSRKLIQPTQKKPIKNN